MCLCLIRGMLFWFIFGYLCWLAVMTLITSLFFSIYYLIDCIRRSVCFTIHMYWWRAVTLLTRSKAVMRLVVLAVLASTLVIDVGKAVNLLARLKVLEFCFLLSYVLYAAYFCFFEAWSDCISFCFSSFEIL